jgi:uncharacterized coiled-coil DUF342 family protein
MTFLRPCGFALMLCALPAQADDAAAQLAQQTANNIAFISAQLADHQKEFNRVAAKRIDMIATLERLAASSRQQVESEVDVLKQTGGEDLVKFMDALRERADKSAAAPALLDALQAQVRKDLNAAYEQVVVPSSQLDGIAKSLTELGKEKDRKERAQFLASYLKEVHQEVKDLKQAASAIQSKTDAQVDAATTAKTTEKINPKP